MLNEIDKFRIQVFQISGFALMMPFGKFFLEPWVIFTELSIIEVISYFLIALFLNLFGIILILRAFDIVGKGVKK